MLKASFGTAQAVTIDIPNTRGLWAVTAPVDVKLEAGKQTLRIVAPLHRGIAVKWIERKQK